ncbi:MAG TPA: isoaspartyl peptidase/L-asparaginase [Pyrinomonadaceae bacterium]|nr:isoaspartyl peptidase/L-asparaginase [Pyrinomonadaceae bacterium]
MLKDENRRKFIAAVGASLAAVALPSWPWRGAEAAQGGGVFSPKLPVLKPFGFVIHGGAGTIERSRMTPEREEAYRAKLSEALKAGFEVLSRGGPGLDAVVAAVALLEDSPLFNAGKGAVFTGAGTNELDASIMDGRSLKAGAVAGVRRIRNPIRLARLVMEKSPHVMMVGEGAEAFARQAGGVELVDPKYFYTEERFQQLKRRQEEERRKSGAGQPSAPPKRSDRGADPFLLDERKFGTVGAVALDRAGNLAAATSTGGMTNKRFGRVGDSPVIGAGTYADNETCAVSCTGDGEYFIRAGVAHAVSAAMRFGGKSLAEASEMALEKVGRLGGEGGLIAIAADGRIATPFNSAGMYRGFVGADGRPQVHIYRD